MIGLFSTGYRKEAYLKKELLKEMYWPPEFQSTEQKMQGEVFGSDLKKLQKEQATSSTGSYRQCSLSATMIRS